jgi:hypothetical protein
MNVHAARLERIEGEIGASERPAFGSNGQNPNAERTDRHNFNDRRGGIVSLLLIEPAAAQASIFRRSSIASRAAS